jgi:hypothetical protein
LQHTFEQQMQFWKLSAHSKRNLLSNVLLYTNISVRRCRS